MPEPQGTDDQLARHMDLINASTVTIGLCARNSERFIGEAIASIMSQDYPHDHMRLVFVDDGSEDGTLSIISDFLQELDFPAKVFSTSWRGIGEARNTVIANSEGDFILWVDSDMVLSPEFLRRLVEFMQRNPRAGIVKGRQELSPGKNLLSTLELYSRAAGRMVDYQSPRGQNKALGTGGALYRRTAIDQAGIFDPKLQGYNEDWDLELRLRKNGWSLHTADVTFNDYERYGLTWKLLWSRYWLRGYHSCYFLDKNPRLIRHYRMFPPSAFLSGLLSSFKLFKLSRQKAVFLTAFECAFKMTAWYAGFVDCSFNSRTA